MTFKASLDRLAKGVTIGVSVLFAVIVTAQVYLFFYGSKTISSLTTLLILVSYFVTYLFRPIHYVVTEDQLVIHRGINDVIIKRRDITRVERITKDQMKWTIRTFGVGGLFGYYGHFVNSKLGSMRWYVTRRDHFILVETTGNKKLLLSPDEPEAFIEELGSSV